MRPFAINGCARVAMKASPGWLRSLESGCPMRTVIQDPAGMVRVADGGSGAAGAAVPAPPAVPSVAATPAMGATPVFGPPNLRHPVDGASAGGLGSWARPKDGSPAETA